MQNCLIHMASNNYIRSIRLLEKIAIDFSGILRVCSLKRGSGAAGEPQLPRLGRGETESRFFLEMPDALVQTPGRLNSQGGEPIAGRRQGGDGSEQLRIPSNERGEAMHRKAILIVAVLAAFCLTGALTAAERGVIYRGVDLWRTMEGDNTMLDFSENPIPAGFFCSASAPFTGRIGFQGVPLETSPAGVFGNTDTIIERLDDAIFDPRGVARTRIQMRALSMVSTAPLRTACGTYNVTVGLDGEQPVTIMEIFRDGSIGGYFLAPLDINVRLSFTPVEAGRGIPSTRTPTGEERSYRPLQLVQLFRLAPNRNAGWTFETGPGGVAHQDVARVDINGDGIPETDVPGTSNFATGWWDNDGIPSRKNVYLNGATLTQQELLCADTTCHSSKHAVRAPDYENRSKLGKQ